MSCQHLMVWFGREIYIFGFFPKKLVAPEAPGLVMDGDVRVAPGGGCPFSTGWRVPSLQAVPLLCPGLTRRSRCQGAHGARSAACRACAAQSAAPLGSSCGAGPWGAARVTRGEEA